MKRCAYLMGFLPLSFRWRSVRFATFSRSPFRVVFQVRVSRRHLLSGLTPDPGIKPPARGRGRAQAIEEKGVVEIIHRPGRAAGRKRSGGGERGEGRKARPDGGLPARQKIWRPARSFATIDLTNTGWGTLGGPSGCCGILGRVEGGFRLPIGEVDEPVSEILVLDGAGGPEPFLILLGRDADGDDAVPGPDTLPLPGMDSGMGNFPVGPGDALRLVGCRHASPLFRACSSFRSFCPSMPVRWSAS